MIVRDVRESPRALRHTTSKLIALLRTPSVLYISVLVTGMLVGLALNHMFISSASTASCSSYRYAGSAQTGKESNKAPKEKGIDKDTGTLPEDDGNAITTKVVSRLYDCCTTASHCQGELRDSLHALSLSNVSWDSANEARERNHGNIHPCNVLPFKFGWLKGFPKTGTGWARCLAENMIESYCARTPECLRRDDLSDGERTTYSFYRNPVNTSDGKKRTSPDDEEGVCTFVWSTRHRHEFSGIMTESLKEVLRYTTNKNPNAKFLYGPPDEATGVVFTIRDPRDVAVSISHWRTNITTDAEMEEHVRAFFPTQLDAMSRYYAKYISGATVPFQYESLKVQPLLEMRRLAIFFGMDVLTDGELAKNVHECSFDVIKEEELETQISETGSNDTETTHARDGSVGQWQKHMSEDLIQTVNDNMALTLPNAYVDCYLPLRSRTFVDTKGNERVDYHGGPCRFTFPTQEELERYIAEGKWTWDKKWVTKAMKKDA
eukprot:TRINITY_DN10734_c0_g1_i2.p1 TRINITY_DN10734_c0_g1~~TRINITY_DN10734_c0_g1_i2.p1  ORF type:complete len:491 (-),score=69.36 TRINITY_DN10734_c0_g1_i2:76-1548(-)